MNSIRAVTVYCSSSRDLEPVYYEAGALLGREIARNGWDLVYGGNRIGLMKSVADGARAAGGKVIGVTPQLLVDKGFGDQEADELFITQNLRDRKAMLEQLGDAFIALPGGLGTFEEIFDIIGHRQLGYHSKPIILLNINRYYDCLIQFIEQGVAQRFIKIENRRLFLAASSVDAAITHLRRAPDQTCPAPADVISSSAAE
ncbi:MAG: TIGR00730 family Rossman fold protein [Phycisphaerae bacterium]|nr:TIGR00730 family Rossman fold protein [Phycisphaerae bacterium]